MRSFLPRLLAAIAIALLVPGSALAGALVLPALEAPASALHPGQEVVTPIPPLPAEVREFELVLVPDVGPAVQVTAECLAGVREVRWRVPRLTGTSARLVLRAGSAREEFASPPSARIAFSAAALSPFDAAAWLGDAVACPAALGAHDSRELAAGGLLAHSAEEPDDHDTGEVPVAVHVPYTSSGVPVREHVVRLTHGLQPRFTPLRN
ncbi:MAG: hypothetical protein U0704_02770 [Candidatus Eisenbacteria bacterium]